MASLHGNVAAACRAHAVGLYFVPGTETGIVLTYRDPFDVHSDYATLSSSSYRIKSRRM